jgi:hypothetical protein
MDDKDFQEAVEQFRKKSPDFMKNLPQWVLIEAENSLMASIKAACPRGKRPREKFNPDLRAFKGAEGHLADNLGARITKEGSRSTMTVYQTGNFNGRGRPYLQYVIKGTSPSKGKYIPGSGYRLTSRRRAGKRAAVSKAKVRYRSKWKSHVKATTISGATRNIGMHPGIPKNNFIRMGFKTWVASCGLKTALQEVLNKSWTALFKRKLVPGEKFKFFIKHPQKALRAYRAGGTGGGCT